MHLCLNSGVNFVWVLWYPLAGGLKTQQELLGHRGTSVHLHANRLHIRVAAPARSGGVDRRRALLGAVVDELARCVLLPM